MVGPSVTEESVRYWGETLSWGCVGITVRVTLTVVTAATEAPTGVTVTVAVSVHGTEPEQAGTLERFTETVTLSGVWPVVATALSQLAEAATEYLTEAPLLNTEKV